MARCKAKTKSSGGKERCKNKASKGRDYCKSHGKGRPISKTPRKAVKAARSPMFAEHPRSHGLGMVNEKVHDNTGFGFNLSTATDDVKLFPNPPVVP